MRLRAISLTDELARLKKRALDLLSRREHSTFELYNKLKRHCDDESLINPLLTELKSQGLLSDHRFADSVRRKVSGKLQGPLRLKRDLSVAKVSADFCSNDEHVDWLSLAVAALEKKFKLHDLTDPKCQAKALRFLAGRGFTQDIAYNALKRLRQQ